MPTLETILNGPSAKDAFAAHGPTANQARGDYEFGHFMDNALPPPAAGKKIAPAEAKPAATAGGHDVRSAARNDSPPRRLQIKMPPGEVSPDAQLDADILPRQEPAEIFGAVKLPADVAGEKSSVDLMAPLPPEFTGDAPPPVFLTLPLAAQFNGGAVSEPVKAETENSGAAEVGMISGGKISAVVGAPVDRSAGLRPGVFAAQPQLAGPETGAPETAAAGKVSGAPAATENSPAGIVDLKLAKLSPLDLAGTTLVKADAPPAGAPSTRSAGIGQTDGLAEQVLGAPILPDAPVNLKTVAAAAAATPTTDSQISISDLKPAAPPVVTTAPTTTAATGQPVETISAPALPAAEPSAEKFSPVSFPIYAAMSAELSSEKVAPENAGTGVAPDASAMKNSDNGNKAAGLDANVLPGGKVGRAATEVAPQLATVPVRAQENASSDFNLPPMLAGAANPSPAEKAGVIALPALTDAHLRTVERTQELVVMHALRLTKSAAESLSVVIRRAAARSCRWNCGSATARRRQRPSCSVVIFKC